jgi:predicted AAA+ superfamily ATPase
MQIESVVFNKAKEGPPMIPRTAAGVLEELARQFKIVAVVGPRQAGKSTLVRSAFPDHLYQSLEDPDIREFATTDPRRFLTQNDQPMIIDEAQRCPDLFSYLQGVVDDDRRPGRYILTGSQHFGLLDGIRQSLAGRVATLTLLPFSHLELAGSPVAPNTLDDMLFRGLYPPIYDQKIDSVWWHKSYIETYVQRDVRDMIQVRDMAQFQHFLKLCAGSVGRAVNLSELGGECGISHPTAKAWIGILEASFILFSLPPYHRNFRKRLRKTPRLYFHDTGLAARLIGIESPEHLSTHPERGFLFENWAVSEAMKAFCNRFIEPSLYYWRSQGGLEVDLLVERGQLLYPCECKSGATVRAEWLQSLDEWRRLAGDQAEHGVLFYGGDTRTSRSAAEVVPWNQAAEFLAQMLNT